MLSSISFSVTARVQCPSLHKLRRVPPTIRDIEKLKTHAVVLRAEKYLSSMLLYDNYVSRIKKNQGLSKVKVQSEVDGLVVRSHSSLLEGFTECGLE